MTDVRRLTIPELSLVLLVGASSSGKSTFARKHFKSTEVLSSDFCRSLVSDDENDLNATAAAFDVLRYIAEKRLKARKLVVVDATNIKQEDRAPLVNLARQYHALPAAIVLNLPERVCQDRNRARPERNLPQHVVRQQVQQMQRSLRGLKREGFRYIYQLRSEEEANTVQVERQRLWTDRRDDHGPFDILGDVHGCCDELEALLNQLGYTRNADGVYTHPEGRRAFFVGDLVDRGPRIVDTLKLVMAMCQAGSAICVPGNHDVKLVRHLQGRKVEITHGLDRTLMEFNALPHDEQASFKRQALEFLDGLVSHFLLDDGKLVVAHAGMTEAMQGRASGEAREFALYGDTTGETDEFGLPVRYDWASDYRGEALVVYGHTPIPEPEWLNRTINIDTGCVFGGKLTALRYPEKTLVSVKARQVYAAPIKPFPKLDEPAVELTAQQRHDALLDVADYMGKMIVHTRLVKTVPVSEGSAAAALEVMTRFAVAPQWLIYLPPAMSPPATSNLPDTLEHPAGAFSYYRRAGITRVVCEEKHMGSRVVVVLCRDETVAQKRFGVPSSDAYGICYTRTGRRFFDDAHLENALLEHLKAACNATNFWEAYETDWLCIDTELMPWSVKAQQLIKQQYAPAGTAGQVSLGEAAGALMQAASRGVDVSALQTQIEARREAVRQYQQAYRRYCWDVTSIDTLKLAPFHLLATEGKTYTAQDHVWHMENLKALCDAAPAVLTATDYRVVDLTNETSQQEAVDWWETLTTKGGEGIVVKPFQFAVRTQRGLVQPAIKCRGREYLRIIYGPEYLLPENLARLKQRNLGTKRRLALQEFALGVEALERFCRNEPLQQVHECVFAILALESEPVDPRL